MNPCIDNLKRQNYRNETDQSRIRNNVGEVASMKFIAGEEISVLKKQRLIVKQGIQMYTCKKRQSDTVTLYSYQIPSFDTQLTRKEMNYT